MKRFLAVFLIFSAILPFFIIPISADDIIFKYDSDIRVSEDKSKLTVSFSLPEGAKDTYHLFRVSPDNESINGRSPISSATAENNTASFILDYNYGDHSQILYGYVLASKDGKTYTALTNARYIENIADLSHSNRDFPISSTIKGLEVQYITDAQLLGVGHTVLHVKLNDLLSSDPETSTAFIYGTKEYHIDNEALEYLDYRISTFNNSGINIYINYILTFDSKLDKALYYPDAKNGNNTIFAPNMSSFESASVFSAIMHFLSERYSHEDGKYGFCGSYIIGYEVNNAAENHNSGIKDMRGHAKAYASYLRFADLAIRSGFSNARIYASVSNIWNSEGADSEEFGAKSFLDEVISLVPDINFGIAINPYPSDLKNAEYWLDEKAEESPDTEYLTMKNLSVLSEYINSDNILINGNARRVVISEFGISGKYGEESERTQAAAYALAYYTASKLPFIEAFIWHRHVDHNYEVNLNYGLYSSSDLILAGKDMKLIYSVFSAVDSVGEDSKKTIEGICELLPIPGYEELIANAPAPFRHIYSVKNSSVEIGGALWKTNALYDFSQGLYGFYPSDNANYLQQIHQSDASFMRIASVRVSPLEYIGASINIPEGISLSDADYITVNIRVLSSSSNADFALIVMGNSDAEMVTVKCSSQIKTNEWATLKFPVSSLKHLSLKDAKLMLWASASSSNEERIYIDVASVKLHTARNIMPLVITIIITAFALISTALAVGYRILRKRKRKINK